MAELEPLRQHTEVITARLQEIVKEESALGKWPENEFFVETDEVEIGIFMDVMRRSGNGTSTVFCVLAMMREGKPTLIWDEGDPNIYRYSALKPVPKQAPLNEEEVRRFLVRAEGVLRADIRRFRAN